MTMRKLLGSTTLVLALMAHGATAQSTSGQDGVFEKHPVSELKDRAVDPNEDLLRLLIISSQKGPLFEFRPGAVNLNMMAGEARQATIIVENAGDSVGTISDVRVVGAIEGLELVSRCDEPIEPSRSCDLIVSYSSDEAKVLETVIVGVSDDRDNKNFSLPVAIRVTAPPPPMTEDPKPRTEPVVVTPPVSVTPPAAVGPTKSDIARTYLGALPTGMKTFESSPRGFAVVSMPDPMRESELAGTAYGDIRVETVTTDPRFQDSVRTTKASLPVNMDKILTSDRVIKAVLETPVSNVMCNKTVALVESDVYSATSSKPLIQAGSRIVGSCKQFVDERVGIAWERIITVDGRSIVFEDVVADTNDAMGLGGALGRVYSSPFDKYVLPIFSTMIDAAAGVVMATFGEDEEVVTDANGNIVQEKSAKNEGIRIVTSEARGTAQEVIKDIRDVREIAVIPAGSRIDVEINEDIVFDDERRVVRVADMSFNLDDIERGGARRELPEKLRLVPAGRSYTGATVDINGRRYKIEEDTSEEDNSSPFDFNVSKETSDVLNDLAPKE